MKEVVITSKVVGRGGGSTPVRAGQGSQVDLSDYLLKAIWDEAWELRTDSNGQDYMFGKLPIVTQYGITMYADDSVDVGTIYDGLPIDGTTIYWENGVLKSLGGGTANAVAWGNITDKPSWIGSDKPVYTMGSLSNVGSWADSVADVDRIMYQASGSSMWVAKSLSDLAVGGDYLPLTGGTISRNDRKHLLLKNQNADGESALWVGGTFENFGTGGIVSFNGSNKTFSFTNFAAYSNSARGIAGIRITNDNRFLVGDANFTDGYTYTVWHSGNDGAGSGLDADLLDGQQGSWYQNNVVAFYTQYGQSISGGKDANVYTSGILSNFGSINYWSNAPSGMSYGNILTLRHPNDLELAGQLAWDINLSSTTDTTRYLWWRATDLGDWIEAKWHQIAFTDSNVASATKLQTARTIWGQSFDGTDDISGDILLGGDANNKIGTNILDPSGGYKEFIHVNSYGYIAIGPFNNSAAHIYTNMPNFYFDKDLLVNGNKVWHAGNDGSGSGLDADKLDGVEYQNILERTYSGSKYCSGVGWYRIGKISSVDSNVILLLSRSFGYTSPESYVFVISRIYSTDRCCITQLSGLYASQNITSVRIDISNTDGYIDFYYNTTASNNVYWTIIGNATAYTSATFNPTTIGTQHAVTPIDGLRTTGDILATGGITMYSQRSLKNVQDERGLSLSELSVIKPTRYTWKDGRDNRIHIGGIADDIQQVLPEVVYKTGDGTLTMDYGNAAFAIASSLIKPVIDHEQRIMMLEEENKELRNELEQLKSA